MTSELPSPMFCIIGEQINDSYVFREDIVSQLLQLSQHIVQSKGNWQTFSDMQWFWEYSFQVPLNVFFQQKWIGELWQKDWRRDFPSGPMVKNLPCSAGDIGSIPGKWTKVPHSIEQLSLCSTNRESVHPSERCCMIDQSSHMTQLRPDVAK